jgi:hypothetical protein
MPVEIDHALLDRRLLGAGFGEPNTWRTWIAVLKAAFGLQLDPQQREIFNAVAGSRAPPLERVRELWAIVGRRGGKSRMAAACAVYCAGFVQHRLAPGEVGMALVLAASEAQARTVFEYVRGLLDASAVLRREVANQTRREITLRDGVVIAVHANSFRTVRGRTLVACVMDECAFWRDESSAVPDVETYRAVLPALATTNGLLIGISTPYRKSGLLYQKHRDHFGIDGDDVLIVQGASKVFNPSLSDTVIEAQRATDPSAAISEWDAIFRTDVGAFLDDELIDGAVEHDRPLELPPAEGVSYQGFTDASGGVGSDAYTVSIGHKTGDRVITDVCRGTVGRFNPQEVTKQYAALLKEYRISKVVGDAYGAEWVAAAWRDCGFEYTRSPKPKSEIYLECIPLFTRGLVGLPDRPKLLRELRLLERHTHRSGKDAVDYPRNGHDDHANAVCGVLHLLSKQVVDYNEIPWVAPIIVMGRRRSPESWSPPSTW